MLPRSEQLPLIFEMTWMKELSTQPRVFRGEL